MPPTLTLDLIIGLPTSEGKMCVGKLLPAYPTFTNLNKMGVNKTKLFLKVYNKNSNM